MQHDAAVVHLEHFLVGADDEVVVDADLAELVDDHGVALAVRLGEDAVEEGGLAGAEIAGEHGDGILSDMDVSEAGAGATPRNRKASAGGSAHTLPYIVSDPGDGSPRCGMGGAAVENVISLHVSHAGRPGPAGKRASGLEVRRQAVPSASSGSPG